MAASNYQVPVDYPDSRGANTHSAVEGLMGTNCALCTVLGALGARLSDTPLVKQGPSGHTHLHSKWGVLGCVPPLTKEL